MKKILLAVIVIQAIAIVGLNNIIQTNNKNLVFQICQNSRQNFGYEEESCADIQDHLGLTYECEKNNPYWDNKCEVK